MTQAAIRAGYSEDTARSIGAENLTKPDIVDSIAEAKLARAERTQVTAGMVRRYHHQITSHSRLQ